MKTQVESVGRVMKDVEKAVGRLRSLELESRKLKKRIDAIERKFHAPPARKAIKRGKRKPDEFIGMLTDAEADAMLKAIEESCEQVES